MSTAPFKPDPRLIAHNSLANTRRRANRARQTFVNTCPASRHAHSIADCLARGQNPLEIWDADEAASAIYSTLESLWKARTKAKR